MKVYKMKHKVLKLEWTEPGQSCILCSYYSEYSIVRISSVGAITYSDVPCARTVQQVFIEIVPMKRLKTLTLVYMPCTSTSV